MRSAKSGMQTVNDWKRCWLQHPQRIGNVQILNFNEFNKEETAVSLGTILLIVIVIILLGGFSGFGGGPFYGTGYYYGGGGLGLVLVIVLILVLLGKL
jgi:hypothetical protein